MAKRLLEPSVGLRPAPLTMVTCVDGEGRPNIITLSWVSVLCSNPPMIGIGVRPRRYSYDLIKNSEQFVVNVPSASLLRAADYCGNRSGRAEDKFAVLGLTPLASSKVKPPLIAECPINVECIVRHHLPLGSHDLFIGEVVAVHADEDALDETGHPSAALAGAVCYDQPRYVALGSVLGREGLAKT